MNKEELQKRVKELSAKESWNHQIELPHGVVTRSHKIDSPGFNTTKWRRILPFLEAVGLKGKNVLDVGCSDGYFSIEAAKLGAKSVVGTEVDPLRIQRATFAAEALEIPNVKFVKADILADDMEGQKFDVVMALGLIHRVPDLDGCLHAMSKMADILLLEFKTLNQSGSHKKWHGGKTKSNTYNPLHYTPTLEYVQEKLTTAGYTNIKLVEDVTSSLQYKRSIILAQRGESKA